MQYQVTRAERRERAAAQTNNKTQMRLCSRIHSLPPELAVSNFLFFTFIWITRFYRVFFRRGNFPVILLDANEISRFVQVWQMVMARLSVSISIHRSSL